MFPQKKGGTRIIFSGIEIPCRGDTVLNLSVSTERSIPIRPDSVFQVRQILCQSEVKIQPLTSIVDPDLHGIPRYSIVTYIFHCYVKRLYKHIIVYVYFKVFFNQSRCSGIGASRALMIRQTRFVAVCFHSEFTGSSLGSTRQDPPPRGRSDNPYLGRHACVSTGKLTRYDTVLHG